jgi:hypothetical protein
MIAIILNSDLLQTKYALFATLHDLLWDYLTTVRNCFCWQDTIRQSIHHLKISKLNTLQENMKVSTYLVLLWQWTKKGVTKR